MTTKEEIKQTEREERRKEQIAPEEQ